jgi:hypothetical protein
MRRVSIPLECVIISRAHKRSLRFDPEYRHAARRPLLAERSRLGRLDHLDPLDHPYQAQPIRRLQVPDAHRCREEDE